MNDGDDTQIKGATDQTLIGNNGDKLKVDGSGVTQPISAAALPLPAGAATSANQVTELASLASIDAGIPAALGQTTMSASMPVTLASNQSALAITAASLPLPTGASTSANQVTELASLASIDAGIPAALGQTTMAASMPVVISSNQSAIAVTGTLTTTLSTINDTSKGREYTSFSPDPSSYPDIISEVSLDYSDNLMVRGQVLTDEGSFRDDFTGSSLTSALTGNIQWGGNDPHVVGTGSCLFTTEVKAGDYVKKTSDPESAWTQVDYLVDDNSLYLVVGYLGTNGTSVGSQSAWKPATATGGAITVSSSSVSISSGTTSGQTGGISHIGDYLPYNLRGKFLLSQRILNQTTTFGFQDNLSSPAIQACFIFDGTVNTTVKCRSSSSIAAADTQETSVSIPLGGTSAVAHTYRIDITSTNVYFTIDGVTVATHADHIPGPYDSLTINFAVKNTAAVTSTTISADYISFLNSDQLEITTGFTGETIAVSGAFYQATQPISGTVTVTPLTTTSLINVNSIPVDGTKQTFSTSITGLVPAASPTDIFTVLGSASKIVRITRIAITGTQTTATQRDVLLIKRSSADTGGTSSVLTAGSHDSTNAASTAVVRAYTANPSALGTSAGTIRTRKVFIGTTTSNSDEFIVEFGTRPSQAVVLRGVTESLAVNLNAATSTGNNFDISIEWTEE